MEVGTHTLSPFDLNSISFPCTSTAAAATKDCPESRTQVLRTSGMLGSSAVPKGEGFESPTAKVRECQGMSDGMASASTFDAASPETNCGECHGSVVVGEVIAEEKLKRYPSDAAMKVQKVYRSYRTRRMLADSAVVAEELWWQALDYARLNHSTISFFNFLKPETAASRWSRVRLNASKVGKGLSKDAKAQTLAFQHWIEAIDPRHRYGHSLHKYYEEWCKADAGQPFFYWLDLGDGKEVDLKDCPRSQLRHQGIKYLGPQERENYEYQVVEGEIVHKQTGKLLDTRKGSSGTKWIFVMSTSKRLYAGEKKKGNFHHSSFLAGGVTLAAGRMVVEDGIVKSISAYSGHYRPTEDSLDSFLQFLKDNGVDLDNVEIRTANEDYEFEDGKSTKVVSTSEVSTASDSLETNSLNDEETDMSSEAIEIQQAETSTVYRRTFSGGLQSPKAEVPKTAILQRINSKKAAMSYQLGKQLSLKWSTGAGPRIGCVADYPIELRLQALELTNLSPRSSPMQVTPRRVGTLTSPPPCPSRSVVNGDSKSS